ncbi:MAG: 3-isopropylmalate dehydratase large subunit [Deltaproteobacteria bacterium]|nr:3-isopropylmalate dehydratase large subunit [Deltaproteobacteria bacterium]
MLEPSVAADPPRTLYEKLWQQHLVVREGDDPAILYVDLHLLNDVTSQAAFTGLRTRGVGVRRPARTLASMDHLVLTATDAPPTDELAARQLDQLARDCRDFGVALHAPGSGKQGVLAVLAPELGLIHPGMSVASGEAQIVACGAFGALPLPLLGSEVELVLATQCLVQRAAASARITISGSLGPCVTPKDLGLFLAAELGVGALEGQVVEYAGPTVRGLDMEGRMTLCNLSLASGARAALIAPDETTLAYLVGRCHAPKDRQWERLQRLIATLRSDEGAFFRNDLSVDVSAVPPMLSYGIEPSQSLPVTGRIPHPETLADEDARQRLVRALGYMGLEAGQALQGIAVDVVYLGSCSNGRLSDLRLAAQALSGRRVDPRVRLVVAPGAEPVAAQAEAEGLDRIFRAAGAEWRRPGCGLCMAAAHEAIPDGQVCLATTAGNYQGRQGPGARTLLASPLTAIATAVTGAVVDPRQVLSC